MAPALPGLPEAARAALFGELSGLLAGAAALPGPGPGLLGDSPAPLPGRPTGRGGPLLAAGPRLPADAALRGGLSAATTSLGMLAARSCSCSWWWWWRSRRGPALPTLAPAPASLGRGGAVPGGAMLLAAGGSGELGANGAVRRRGGGNGSRRDVLGLRAI